MAKSTEEVVREAMNRSDHRSMDSASLTMVAQAEEDNLGVVWDRYQDMLPSS